MPNKICYFGCNKFKQLSIFTIPKDQCLRNKWLESLEVNHFSATDVICEDHFQADLIKRSNNIIDNLGNIICSVSRKI